MLTGRNVLVAAIAITVLSMISITWTQDTDSNFELGRNTLGVRPQGHRGLFDTLRALDIDVRRNIVPPNASLSTEQTLVFLEPDISMLEIEPAYISNLNQWVENGGCVVYSPARSRAYFSFDATPDPDSTPPKEFAELIGIGPLNVSGWTVVSSDGQEPAEVIPSVPPKFQNPSTGQSTAADFGSVISPTAIIQSSLAVQPEGRWQSLADSVSAIRVPKNYIRLLKSVPDSVVARLVVPSDNDEELTVAAMFEKGKGSVIVFSDPIIAHNGYVAQEDNAVALVSLLTQNETVLFDEFYHGMVPRGNPFVLLKRPSFTILIGLICLTILIYAWRHGIRLGPASVTKPVSRRSLREYVDAMSRMFAQSDGHVPFLLRESRSGLVWTLRCELAMTSTKNTEEDIIRILQRRQPERAKRFADCLKEFDRLLSQRAVAHRDDIHAINKVSDCL